MLHRVFSKFFFPLQILQFVILSYKNFVWYKFRSNESYDVDAHIFLVNFVDLSYLSPQLFQKTNVMCAKYVSATYVFKEKKM